jgi:GH24 family phage-related lysozyme (muramidase)
MRRVPLWVATGSLVAATAMILAACRDDWLREDARVRPAAAPPPPPPEAPKVATVEAAMEFIRPMEGRRARAYRDTRKVPTIGVGFNLRRGKLAQERLAAVGLNLKAVLHGSVELTDEQIELLFRWDVIDAMNGAKRVQPGLEGLPIPAQLVVIDMVFQMGPTGFSQCVTLRRLLAGGDLAGAAREVLATMPYARQTPGRAQRNAAALASG